MKKITIVFYFAACLQFNFCPKFIRDAVKFEYVLKGKKKIIFNELENDSSHKIYKNNFLISFFNRRII